MIKFIHNLFTARDNQTFSLTKLIGSGAGFTMIAKFWQAPSPDYQSFGIAIAGIIAALAAKYHVEKPSDQ